MKLGAFILGQREDPHVAAVCERLIASGVEVQLLDRFRDQAAITFQGGGRVASWPFLDWVRSCDGVAIWIRVKNPMGEVPPLWDHRLIYPEAKDPAGPYQTRLFWKSEWHAFSHAVRHILMREPNVAAFNPGAALTESECKPLQLEAARTLGFRIPETVIGNSELVIDATFGQEVLYKPLSGAAAAGIGSPRPAMLPKVEVLADGRAAVAPSIFQERVEKSYELRVTVVGKTVTALKIDSQALWYTKLDWRRAQPGTGVFSQVELPDALKDKLFEYMDAFELQYGAFDLAMEPSGEYVFFECNPEGQWLWLELGLDLHITDHVAAAIRSVAIKAARIDQQTLVGHVEPV